MSFCKKRGVKSPKRRSVAELLRSWRKHKNWEMAQKKRGLRGAEAYEEEEVESRTIKYLEGITEQLQSMKTDFNSLRTDISAVKAEVKANNQEIKTIKTDITKNFDDFKEEISGKFDQLKLKTEDNEKEIQQNKTQTQELSREVETLQQWSHLADEKFELLEVQARIGNLRFRGIPETFGKSNLKQDFEKELQEFLQTEDPITFGKIFCVNTRAAFNRAFPREVFVTFDSKNIREAILLKQRSDTLVIHEQEIQIFQDLPRETLRRRAELHFLRRILLKKQIRYFWKIPFALEVVLSTGRHIIKTIAQAHALARQLESDYQGDSLPPAPTPSEAPPPPDQPAPLDLPGPSK